MKFSGAFSGIKRRQIDDTTTNMMMMIMMIKMINVDDNEDCY